MTIFAKAAEKLAARYASQVDGAMQDITYKRQTGGPEPEEVTITVESPDSRRLRDRASLAQDIAAICREAGL